MKSLPYYSITQAASVIGVSPTLVGHWMLTGALPFVMCGDRRVLPIDAVTEFAEMPRKRGRKPIKKKRKK